MVHEQLSFVKQLWLSTWFILAHSVFALWEAICYYAYPKKRYVLGTCEGNRGKWAIITGANTGVGKAAACAFVKDGVNVVIGCRSRDRAEAALVDIRQCCRFEAQAEFIQLDLGSFRSIREFARTYLETHERLDILVNNAGVMATPFCLTEDGFESQIGTNHFGHFLLTKLLLGKLKEAGGARIVSVSSCSHLMGTIDFDTFRSDHRYNSVVAYAQSKLANVLIAYELSRRLAGDGVVVNAIHPGAVATGITRSLPWPLPAVSKITAMLMFKSPETGAVPIVFAALAPETANVTGRYILDTRFVRSSELSYDLGLAKRLVDATEAMIDAQESRTD